MIEFIITFESVINYKNLHFTGIWEKIYIYLVFVQMNKINLRPTKVKKVMN